MVQMADLGVSSNLNHGHNTSETKINGGKLKNIKCERKNPVVCKICDKTLSRPYHLKEHIKIVHDQTKDVFCDKCSKAFGNKLRLHNHQKMVHYAVRDFLCLVCKKGCLTKRELVTHMRCHTGERPFMCDICSKTFITNIDLNAHKRIHDGTMLSCETCKKQFTAAKHLNEHVKFVHLNVQNKKAERKRELQRQKNLFVKSNTVGSTDEKICSICGKSFKKASKTKRHMLSHVPIRQKIDWKKHFSIIDEYKRKCNKCSRVFTNMKSLKEHVLNVHVKEQDNNTVAKKDYISSSCIECNEIFASRKQMNEHIFIVHVRQNGRTKSIINCQEDIEISSALMSEFSGKELVQVLDIVRNLKEYNEEEFENIKAARRDGSYREMFKRLGILEAKGIGTQRSTNLEEYKYNIENIKGTADNQNLKPNDIFQCNGYFESTEDTIDIKIERDLKDAQEYKTIEDSNDSKNGKDGTDNDDTNESKEIGESRNTGDPGDTKNPKDTGDNIDTADIEDNQYIEDTFQAEDIFYAKDILNVKDTTELETPILKREHLVDNDLSNEVTNDVKGETPLQFSTQRPKHIPSDTNKDIKEKIASNDMKKIIVHKRKKFKTAISCTLCKKVFKKQSKMKMHFVTHTKAYKALNIKEKIMKSEDGTKFNCLDCGKGFLKHKNLRDHIINVHYQLHKNIDLETIKDSSILETFRKRYSFEIDSVLSDGTSFQCEECGKSFVNRNVFKRHVMEHRSKFICSYCQKSFSRETSLKDHINTIHIGTKEHKCTKCEAKYSTSATLKCHIKKVHTPYSLICTKCGNKFALASQLKKHGYVHNPELKPLKKSSIKISIKCLQCEKGYNSKEALRKHVDVVHMGLKNHTCSDCGKAFGRLSTLISHTKNIVKPCYTNVLNINKASVIQ